MIAFHDSYVPDSDSVFGASDARPARSRALPALDVLTSVFGFRGSGSGGGGGSVNDRLALGNFAAGGSIGTAAATVDAFAQFIINQTTAGQTLSLPTPTVAALETSVVVSNGGTTPFIMHGKILPVNGSAVFVWNTNTASWLDPLAWQVPLAVAPAVNGNVCTGAQLDAHDQINVNPGAAGLTLTLPTPTANQTGKLVRVSNVGVDSFTMYGCVLQDGFNASNPAYAEFSWNGLNWLPASTAPVGFGPSGAGHAPGDVPDPGAVAGTTRFLREDATWSSSTINPLAPVISANSFVIRAIRGSAPNGDLQNESYEVENDLATTTNAAASIYAFTPIASSVTDVVVTLVGTKDDETVKIKQDVAASFAVTAGGAVTEMGSNTLTTLKSLGTTTGFTFAIDTSGGQIRVRVTPPTAGGNYTWGSYTRVTQRSVTA